MVTFCFYLGGRQNSHFLLLFDCHYNVPLKKQKSRTKKMKDVSLSKSSNHWSIKIMFIPSVFFFCLSSNLTKSENNHVICFYLSRLVYNENNNKLRFSRYDNCFINDSNYFLLCKILFMTQNRNRSFVFYLSLESILFCF